MRMRVSLRLFQFLVCFPLALFFSDCFILVRFVCFYFVLRYSFVLSSHFLAAVCFLMSKNKKACGLG